MRRRTLLAAAALSPVLGGCGFALRRPPQLAFERVALVGFAQRSPVRDALVRALDGSVTITEAPQQAQVVLESLLEQRRRLIVASTPAGRVRDLSLRVRFQYRLSTRGGRPLIEPTELLLFRDMSYDESIALAKAQEENELFRDMETDIAQQVLRRLETVRGI